MQKEERTVNDLTMKYLFRLYQWLIAAPILLVVTILTAIVTVVGCLFSKSWGGYYPAKVWACIFCWLLFVRVKVKGREKINKKTSYVFVANHQGAFDIFSIYGFLGHNFRWMMRKGLTNIPVIGQACQIAGHILVDHSSAAALKKTMEDAEKRLADDMSLVVFPEGRRTDDGEMASFKSGAFRLAVEFNLPVVPIAINGSYRVMPRTTFNVTPGTITLTLHDPIMPGAEGHDQRKLMQQCYDTISQSLD